MTREDRRKCREIIALESGWHRYGIIDEPPSILDYDKEFEIIYENMDGEACFCSAIYRETNVMGRREFFATDGSAKGLQMMYVVAYRVKGDRRR